MTETINYNGRSLYLGLKPPQPEAIQFKLGDYLNLPEVPNPPDTFGHVANIPYGMLGNDKAGCCVMAGAAHETVIWTRATKRPIAEFTPAGILSQYAKLTGWDGNPGDSTDTGLDIEQYANVRRKFGLLDSALKTHRIDAYAQIDSPENAIKASYVFGACALGIEITTASEEQFNAGQPWTPAPGRVLGYHYVPLVGRNSHGYLMCITWGQLQALTLSWLKQHMKVAVAYITQEYLNPHTLLTPRLLDLTRLRTDLAAL